mmetsp:Transcript_22806/g.22024  ORF Transcript_22806/g.22024 Transcript_22806/m.22024 type:complete len:137 (+) Transcript_22806:1286-1696(+)
MKKKKPSKLQKQAESLSTQKEEQQMQNNQAKCLGYLISLVKIFLLAALLKVDETKLLTLIVQSSTSPYRRPKTMKSFPPSKLNQLLGSTPKAIQDLGGTSTSGLDISRESGISRDNSSVNTPKFHSSHSSNSATPP